jgi:hypothetical protein
VNWALLAAVVGACGGNKPIDRPPIGDDDSETTPPECVGDEQCAHGREVCEAEVCVPGDRDGDFATATAVGLGDPVAAEGWIFPEGDVDRFFYRAPGPQWVSIATVSNDASDLDTIVSVWTEAGELHAFGDGFPIYPYSVVGTLRGENVTFDTVMFVYLPTAGVWYLQVEDRSTWTGAATGTTTPGATTEPRGGRNWRYDLVVNEAPGTSEPDTSETPSWTFDVASESVISLVGVVIDQPGDVDHVQIDFPFEDHLLEIWGQPDMPGSTAAPVVRLLDGPDLVAEKAGLGDEWLSWFGAHAGTFSLEASNANGGGGPSTWFMLYARTYRAADSHPFFGTDHYEPEQPYNNTPAEAQVLLRDPEFGGASFRLEGTIEAPGDEDWWLIEAEETDLVSVRCWTDRFGSLAALDLGLATGGGVEWLAADAPDADDLYVSDQPMPGPGPLELRVGSAGGGPGHWYRCAATVTP